MKLLSLLKEIFSPPFKTPVKQEPVVVEGDKWFHGVDLDEWNYIGATKITVATNTLEWGEQQTGSATVFFFSKIDDDDNRKYVIIDHHDRSGRNYKTHPFVIGQADPWRIGETDLYMPVLDRPSRYLKELMFSTFGVVWGVLTPTQNWWIKNEDAMYKAATEKQQDNTKPEITQVEENVVSVDFGKKKE